MILPSCCATRSAPRTTAAPARRAPASAPAPPRLSATMPGASRGGGRGRRRTAYYLDARQHAGRNIDGAAKKAGSAAALGRSRSPRPGAVLGSTGGGPLGFYREGLIPGGWTTTLFSARGLQPRPRTLQDMRAHPRRVNANDPRRAAAVRARPGRNRRAPPPRRCSRTALPVADPPRAAPERAGVARRWRARGRGRSGSASSTPTSDGVDPASGARPADARPCGAPNARRRNPRRQSAIERRSVRVVIRPSAVPAQIAAPRGLPRPPAARHRHERREPVSSACAADDAKAVRGSAARRSKGGARSSAPVTSAGYRGQGQASARFDAPTADRVRRRGLWRERRRRALPPAWPPWGDHLSTRRASPRIRGVRGRRSATGLYAGTDAGGHPRPREPVWLGGCRGGGPLRTS